MTDLEAEFREVCKSLCEEFCIDYNKIRFNERPEKYSVGEYYNTTIEDGETIIDVTVESLPSETDESKLEKSSYFSIKENETGSPIPYSISAFDCFAYYGDSLSYWIRCTAFRHNIKYHAINLDQIFGSHRIQIMGISGAREPTYSLIYLILSGLHKIKSDQLVVYRFRHMNDEREFFHSYAFYLPNELWICFPDAAGWKSDSEFIDIEELLGKKYNFKIKRKFEDIEYKEFKSFLEKKALRFPSDIPKPPQTVLDPRPPYEKVFGADFCAEFQKFSEFYIKKDYPNSLRQLRVIVEEALKITCKKHGIDLSQIKSGNHGIKSTVEILISNQKLNSELRSWFDTFTVIANKAAHGAYPTAKDLEIPHIEERIISALVIGMHLIKELDHSLRKEVTVRSKHDGEIFKIYVIDESDIDPEFEIISKN